MGRSISSSLTFIYKFVFPLIWIGGGGVANILLLLSYSKSSFEVLAVWLIGSVFLGWAFVRLKQVAVDRKFLYISDYRKAIRVPISEIAQVTENMWVRYHPIWIKFKHPTDFGDEIVFMPYSTFSKWLVDTHPVVSELRTLAHLEHDEYS